MKKQLLATTALVGASLLVTGDALAQASPIQMGVKGYWRMFVEAIDSPKNDNMVLGPNLGGPGVSTYTGTTGTANTRGRYRSYQHDIESRTAFTGEGKLDNGITPGVFVQFESFNRNGGLPSGGSASGTNAANGYFGNQERRAKGYFKSAWGELGMGNIDNIERLYATYDALGNLLGSDSPSGIYPLGTTTTYNDPAGGAARIYYLSPKFAGFDLGFSYAPDAVSDTRAAAGFGGFTQDGIGNNRYAGANSQNWTIMPRYIGKIGPVDIGGDYGYTGSSNECRGRTTAGGANFSAGCVGADSDLYMHTVRGYVGWAGFRIGASYQLEKNRNGNSQDYQAFAPGIDYTTGPWTFGVYYGHATQDNFRTPAGVQTNNTVAGATKSTDTLDMVAPNVVYLLGPGVRIEAGYAWQRYKYGPNSFYRNAGDFGTTLISSQTANVFLLGATFSY